MKQTDHTKPCQDVKSLLVDEENGAATLERPLWFGKPQGLNSYRMTKQVHS